jgi:exopolysaccharide production protein ExoQ
MRFFQSQTHAFAALLLLVMGVGPVLVTLTSTRVSGVVVTGAFTGFLNLALSGIGLLTSLLLLIRHFDLRVPRAAGTILTVSLLATLTSLVAGVYATVPGIYHEALYFLAAACALAVTAPQLGTSWLIRSTRLALLPALVGSLIAGLLMPAFATIPYIGTLPSRLFGVVGHANILGPMAALFLTLGLYAPARLRGEWLWGLIAAAVLLWTQSKTSLSALGVAVIYVGLARLNLGNWIAVALTRITVIAALVAGVVYSVTSVASELDTVQLDSYTTLTGRTDIWGLTLAEWRSSPAFGYGPGLWSQEYRNELPAEYGWVPHAHNQLIQTLGQQGTVGAVGLLALVCALAGLVWRSRIATQHLSVAVFILLAFRMFTEAPLTFTGFNDSLLQLTVLIAICTASKSTLAIPRTVEMTKNPTPTSS